MNKAFLSDVRDELDDIREQGLYKEERVIISPQNGGIDIQGGQHVLNFCANNYLGLADHPRLIEAAKQGLDQYGFGLASVRFICGTQAIHKELEQRISSFLETEDTILYPSCFDANGGLFEVLLGPEDAILSDSLNHASIIDGVRLCKAQRYRYKNNDMEDLETKLKESQSARRRLIATDGVFSMDGTIANLKAICDLADKYQALVMIDDCHAVGFMGEKGKGTPEYCDVLGRIDIITGTLGKALGGASGGYTSSHKEIINLLRQRSRPYLFSNTLAPAIAAASIEVLDILEESNHLRQQVHKNASHFRKRMTDLGFNLVPGNHPIIPIMLGEAQLAQQMADRMLQEGIYVIGFSYPVVPKGQARIRTQMSAAHSLEEVDKAVDVFAKVGRELNIIGARASV